MRLKPRVYYLAAREYERTRARLAIRRRAISDWTGVRILGYHRIADARDVLAVHPQRFREQMTQLLEWGIEPVSLVDSLELLETPIVTRYFAVTFDDGYRDVFENAIPTLRELGIPATIFLPTRVIEGQATYSWYRIPPPALDWSSVEELTADGLFDVQAHGRTHRALPRLSDEEVRDEIFGSKEDIEARLGREASVFCYPAGLYGDREVALVKEAGFRGAVTTDPGVNDGTGPRETLARTMMSWGDRDREFAAKISGLLDSRTSLGTWIHQRRAKPTSGSRGLSSGDGAADP